MDRPAGQRPATAFTLSDEEELVHEHVALSPGSNSSHRPQAVFNLDQEYSDDDALLDWEQYAGMNRVRCCGLDCTPLARKLRPPQWWFTYTKRQRRCMLGTALGISALLALLVTLIALAAIRGGRSGGAMPGDLGGTTGGSGIAPTEADRQLCAWQDYRLPGEVVPRQYNLTLDVEMEGDYLVEGSVAIAVDVLQATSCVVLHASDMQILEARLGGPTGLLGSFEFKEAEEQLVLSFDEVLPQPQAVLWITFQYNLSDGLSGFYRSTYTLADGTPRSLATTQFEANAARTAFPCFDEPALKAVFNTEIIAPAALQVLSNTAPRAVHQHDHGHGEAIPKTWHFLPTPPMSTYLVCFIIGDFASTSRVVVAGPSGSVNVSVWGTPDRVGNLQFAADTAAAVLPAYEAALGVEYSMDKLDLVAIPDFAAGAMENWGLITYRETALLTSTSSSILDLRYVTLVVAHEMAHQFFGDLVTMDFWGELWLNEGFASYIEYLGATAAHPESGFFDTFYSDTLPRALYFDSKKSSHAMSIDPAKMNTTDTIESVFDAVMYQKGAAVLRMVRAWANRDNSQMPLPTYETTPGAKPEQDTFLLGLQHYLQQYSYSSTHATDLWVALSGPLGFDVAAAMQQWTYRRGYPLVSVSVEEQRRVWLHQAPFGLQGAAPCDPSTAWWIPISYVTSDHPKKLQWTELNHCQSSKPLMTLRAGGGASWVKLNAQQYGFFRVQYTPKLWTGLAAAARAMHSGGMVLSGTDLAGLIEDSYSLAEAGEAPITHFLDLLQALQVRPAQDNEPWAAALTYLYKLERLLPCYTGWRRWVGDVLLHNYLRQQAAGNGSGSDAPLLLFSFAPGATSVPVDQQTIGYRLLRPAILKAAGLFTDLKPGGSNLRAEALNMLAQLEGGEGTPQAAPAANNLDADIRSAVYQAAARSGDWEVYNQLQEMYKHASEADEKERALLALGYAPGGSRILATLQFALSKDVRAQDVRSLVVTTAANAGHDAVNITWGWMQQNFDALFAKLGGDDEAALRMSQTAERVASLFADVARQQEVDDFFTQHKGRQIDPGYAARSKESIAANARWLEQHGVEACAWVEQQQGGRR